METHTWKESRSVSRNSKRVPFRGPRRIYFKLYFTYRTFAREMPSRWATTQQHLVLHCSALFLFFIDLSSTRGDCLDSKEGENNFKLKNSHILTDLWCVCSVRWHCCLRNDWNSISKWANKCSQERDTNLQCLYFKQELILTSHRSS